MIGPQLLMRPELWCPECGQPITGEDADKERAAVALFGGKTCGKCGRVVEPDEKGGDDGNDQ